MSRSSCSIAGKGVGMFFAAALAFGTTWAATTNEWVGANTATGTADMTSLSDANNWLLGHVPTSDEVALMRIRQVNVTNELCIGAGDAAFSAGAVIWSPDDWQTGLQKLYIDRSLTLDHLGIWVYNTAEGGGGVHFCSRVVVGEKTTDPVTLTLTGNDNPLRVVESNGMWADLNVYSNATVNFTGNDIHFSAPTIKRLFDTWNNCCLYENKDQGPKVCGKNATVNFPTSGAAITIEDQKWRGCGLGTGTASFNVRSDQTWHCASNSFAWIVMRNAVDGDHDAGPVIGSIDGGRLDNLGEVNLRFERYAAVHAEGKGSQLLGGTYGSLYLYGGNTTTRNGFVDLAGDVRLKSRCVELSTDPNDESKWAHPVPYGIIMRTIPYGMSHFGIFLGGHKLEVDYGVLIADTDNAAGQHGSGPNKFIDARDAELVIHGDFAVISDGAPATAASPLANCGIRANAGTVLSLGGSFTTNMKAYEEWRQNYGFMDATINLIGGTEEVKTIEVGDASTATAANAMRATFAVGTLNVGTVNTNSDVRLVNEYLNNNPKAEGDGVDPADGRSGEKLIVKNLAVAGGSRLRVNGQVVEVATSLTVAEGGVIDFADATPLEIGAKLTNFYGVGDQSAEWSAFAANVVDSSCPRATFRAVYDQSADKTYFQCKSIPGLVITVR